MFFIFKKALKTPEGVRTKNIFLGGTFNIGEVPTDIYAITLIKNAEVRDLIHSVCNFKIAKFEEFSTPVAVVDDVTVAQFRMTDCTGLYDTLINSFNANNALDTIITQNNNKMFSAILDRAKVLCESNFKNVLGDKCGFLAECILGFYRFSNFTKLKDFSGVPANMIDPDCISATLNYINSFKRVTVIGDNVTLKQNVYNDEFFIKIPSYPALTSDEIDDMNALIPNLRKEVCMPYTEYVAYTPNYKQAVDTPIKLIEGQNSNNGNLIFSYNERYYKSLLAQVKENIMTYYEDSESTILDANGELKDNAVIDPYSQDYLLCLCKQLYSLHWAHNRLVPAVSAKDLNGDSEDSDSYVTAESKYEFYFDDNANGNYINALILLENYLKKVSVKCGYKIYVDAVMQLSRWGLDKPTALVFDNYDQVFILGNNTVKNKDANLEDCIVLQHNGFNSYVSGLLVLDKAITDKGMEQLEALAQFFSPDLKIPVGICITTDYVSKDLAQSAEISNDSIIKNTQYYSAIDFVRKVVKDPEFTKEVDGIVWDGNIISLSEHNLPITSVNQVLVELHSNSTLTSYNPFFRSEDLVNIYMDIGARVDEEIPSSILTILNNKFASPNLSTDFKTISFSTKEELMTKKQSYQIVGSVQNAIDICVLKEVLPVFFKANQRYVNSAEDFLTAYKQVMDEGFSTETAFYQFEHKCCYCEIGKKEESTTKGNTAGTQKMDVFSPVPITAKQESDVVKTEVNTAKEKTESVPTQTENQTGSILIKDKIPTNVKCVPKIIITSDKTKISMALQCSDANGRKETILMTFEEFEKLFPNQLRNVKRGFSLKFIATHFFNQCINLENLDNMADCIYFYSKNAYNLVSKAILNSLN